MSARGVGFPAQRLDGVRVRSLDGLPADLPGAPSRRETRLEGRVDQPPQNAPSTPLRQMSRGDPIGMGENFARQTVIIGGWSPIPFLPGRLRPRGSGPGRTREGRAPKQPIGPLPRPF